MKSQVINSIATNKIVAILRKVPSTSILNVADALYKGGIRCLEITFNQGSNEGITETVQQITMLSKEFSDRLLVGAGTVMSAEQVRLAHSAGASFIISPNVNEAVIRETNALDMVSIPGAMTPTEIVFAYELGADFVKVFPASDLGPDYIKAVRGPLSYIPMLAVGGIDASNMESFLAAGCCGFGIGGKLVDKKAIQNGQYDQLVATAKSMVEVVNR